MTKTGTLIAVEGIDGSGKRTQVELLTSALAARGYSVFSTGFPQYGSWFGRMVGQFLNGDLGPLDSVDPHFTAMLYAGDRFESKAPIETALGEGKIVIADRYIGSNLAHQVARVSAEKRSELASWIEHLEYVIYGLPRESLILYLRVPPVEAQKLVKLKAERSYTSAKQDLLEASIGHLVEAAEMYDSLSRRAPWTTVQCFDGHRRALRSPEEIAGEVLAAVQPILAGHSAKGGR